MIDLIVNFKWYLFIIGEIIFWGCIVSSLIVRYKYNNKKISQFLIKIWFISDLWLLILAVIVYLKTGEIDTFQIIILLALIYGFTEGKKDLKKLDIYFEKRYKNSKREK